MELAFYNTVLAGMQLDGKRFFYVNPLRVDPGISGISATHRHTLPMRPKWYGCACCPPNVARIIGSFGKYAYGESDDTAYCHLFAAGEVVFSNGMRLNCEMDYPYDMTVRYNVSGTGRLAVRIPSWSASFKLTMNEKEIDVTLQDGYVYLDIAESAKPVFTFDGTPRFMRATNKIPGLSGLCVIKRGPLVYCFEGADNGSVRDLRIDKSSLPEMGEFNDKLGAVTLTVNAYHLADIDNLYTDEPETLIPCKAVAVPYYTWGNRGENEMSVWVVCR